MVPRQIFRPFVTATLFILTLICLSREARCDTFSGTRSMTVARYMHTATLLHNSKVLVAGGQDGSTAVSSTELYDSATGRFTPSGSMSIARYAHTATMLPNGKVLIAGGCDVDDSSVLGSAELYDPAAGVFIPAGVMKVPRRNHTATLLQSGKVLFVGGFNGTDIVGSAEVYDPATGVFTSTGSLTDARHVHNATPLQNGKVLISGGWGAGGASGLRSAEVYDPATGSFIITGGMAEARWGHTATILSDGKILVAGGSNGTAPLTAAELYDPVTGAFSVTGSMAAGRYAHSAILLPNGKALVVGGNDGTAGLKSLETYDPAAGTFTAIFGPMSVGRAVGTATLLLNGEVLVAGGTGSALEGLRGDDALNNADVYNPANGSFAVTGSMADARYYLHTSTPLPDGKVLIAGGSTLWSSSVIDGAELYDPAKNVFSSIPGGMTTSRSWHTATLLPNGKVLVSGGWSDSPVNSAEVYDPATTVFTVTGNMTEERHAHTATLLPNGKVLIAGGSNGPDFLRSAEIYDPATGTFISTGSMTTARAAHTATLLANGKVLIVGGHHSGTVLKSAEIYDPSTGIFTATGEMTSTRTLHTATLLPNNKVLIAGGYDNPSFLGNAELYDPDTGTFEGTGGMTSTRCYHSATLLPNGKVLITGGINNDDVILSSAELYDPATEAFQPAANMTEVRNGHTTALLPTGRVLIAGGWGADLLNSAELYDVGLGYAENRRPVINNVIFDEGTLLLTGSGFWGGSITSGGASDNCSGHPILMLQRLDNGMTSFLLPDPAALWSDTSLASILPDLPAGSYQATVFANAVPSISEFFTVTGLPEVVNGACGDSDGATLTAMPTDLCTSGTASGVTGSGPWSWTCTGANGGSTAACLATIQTYIISFAGNSHGSLTGLTSQNVSHGGSTTAVTAVPAFGYHFVNWTGSNGFVSTANPLKVSTVTSGMTFTAHYTVNTITLGLSEYATVKKINAAIFYPSAVQMQFSFDNVKWKKWEKYSTTKVLFVPSKDGGKTVFCRFKDGSGNISATYSDTILLDTKAPKGTIKINGGGLNTKDRDITLEVTANDLTSGIRGICIKESTAACSTGDFVPMAASMNYRLASPGDGKKKVYAVFRDVAGKTSKAVKASITLDTAAPTGTILINKGEPTTTDPEVKLKLSGVKVSHMQLSLDGGATWGNWEKFASSRKVRLTSGAGEKTLVVRFRDLSGNVSPDYSAKITLADG